MIYRAVLAILLAATLAGCSGLRLGYRHADTYLAWRADEYFSFDQRQKQEFNTRAGRLLAWHRYEQLPEYAIFVNAAIRKGQSGLRHEDINWFIEGVNARFRLVVDQGIDDAVEMLAGVTPAQIADLQKQWGKDNRKFSREHKLDDSPAQRRHALTARTLKQVSEWTGSLTDDQEQKIEALSDAIPLVNHLRHQDRISRQKEFLEVLKIRANRSEFQPRLHAWLRHWERGRTPEYVRLSDEVYEKRIQFYIAFEKLLSPVQRRNAWRRLQEFADDFDTLSKKTADKSSYRNGATKLALGCTPQYHACLFE